MPSLTDLLERVERLLLRHDELKRTNALLQEQVQSLSQERDSLRSRALTRPASRIALISLSTWLTALVSAASPPSGQPSR